MSISNRRLGNNQSKRKPVGMYNTDIEDVKKQSKIPRIRNGSVEPSPRVEAKEVSSGEDLSKQAAKGGSRRSQSYLPNGRGAAQRNENASNLRNLRKGISGSASKAVSNGAGNRRSANYKPYTLREYREKFQAENNYKMRGGLGANIGGDEWMKENEKRLRIKNFSSRVKSHNTGMVDVTRNTNQTNSRERNFSRPNLGSKGKEPIILDNFEDEDEDGEVKMADANNEYSYAQHYSASKALPGGKFGQVNKTVEHEGYQNGSSQYNGDKFASEIDKIRAMFN